MLGRIRIGLPKMHGRIRIGLPKVHGQFRIGPPQVFHPICPHLISTVGEFRCTIAMMQEKHQNYLFEIERFIPLISLATGLSARATMI